jgi:putative peptidoglycan lipid II flippase
MRILLKTSSAVSNGTAIQDRMPIAHISRAWSYVRTRQLVWDTLTTTVLSTFGKGVGFLIPFFIAAWFGVSAETDAFFYAYGLIIFLAIIFSPVIESVIVPFIAEARAKNEDVGDFVGKILCTALVVLAALSAVFLLFIKPVLPFISRFSPEGIDLIFVILLEAIPLAVLLVLTSILSGTLNAFKMFGIPAMSPAFRGVVTIAFILVFKDSLGVHSIALGYVAGEAARLAILFAVIRRLKAEVRLKLSFGWDKKFTYFLKISSYQVAGMSVLAFTSIINKTMASWTGTGGVSLLEYAERLYMIPSTLLTSGVIVTLLSHWSSKYGLSDYDGLKRDVAKKIKIIGFVGLLFTIIIWLLKEPIASLVYGHGQFSQEQLGGVSRVLGFYCLGLVPYFMAQVYTRALLVRQNTKALFHAALITISATLALNYILVRNMGVAGLALASSLVLMLISFYLHFTFYRRVHVV